jgi:hypothetical protein
MLAHLAMRPWLAPMVWPFIVRAPWLMTVMARGAGKARVPPNFQGVLPLDGLASLEDTN